MKNIPTLTEIYAQIERNLKNNLDLNNTELKLVLDAIASTFAGQIKLLYLFLQDIEKNSFPDTADPASEGGTLSRLGYIFLGRYPFTASDGYYKVRLTGVEGSVLRNQITFKSSDDALSPGKMFILDGEYTLTGTDDIITIRSVEGGVGSLLSVNDELNITEPVIGVDSVVVVTEIVTRPTAAENTEDYRQKVLDVIQIEPQGGSRGDYRIWASDSKGVRKVYPYVKENNAGVVQVYVEATKIDSIDGKGTPSQNTLTEVRNVIEFDPDETKPDNERGRRPMQAIVEVLPITIRYVDVLIRGLENQSQNETDNLFNGLQYEIDKVRPFIVGADLDRNRNDILSSGKLQASALDSISRSNFFSGFEMYVDGQLETSFQFTRANIPVLRNVNYG